MRYLSKPNKTKWKQKLRNPKILKRREYLVVTNTTRVSYKSPVSYHRQALTWRHYAKLFLIEATVDEDIYCWVIKRSITVTITKLDMEILLRDNLQVFFFKLWNNSYAKAFNCQSGFFSQNLQKPVKIYATRILRTEVNFSNEEKIFQNVIGPLSIICWMPYWNLHLADGSQF